jgi:nitroreductase
LRENILNMDFLNLVAQRYSVRQYTDKKVEQDKLQKILQAAQLAPTACNNQPVKLIVVESEAGLAKLGTAAKTYGAPLAIVVCANDRACWKRAADQRSTADIDASIITDHMMLAATELGLGSVWVCNFNCATLVKEFNIPQEFEPVNLLIVGYAEGYEPNPRHFVRKCIDELVVKESF